VHPAGIEIENHARRSPHHSISDPSTSGPPNKRALMSANISRFQRVQMPAIETPQPGLQEAQCHASWNRFGQPQFRL